MLSISRLKIALKESNISINDEMHELLEKIQKNAIALSVDTSELISLIKHQDPEYVEQIKTMEN